MQFSICSYSFHRLLAEGKQDIFQYIEDCKRFGCYGLDPWNAHLAVIRDEDTVMKAGQDPRNDSFSAATDDYIERVKAAADEAGMPILCVAVDGAHIWEDTPEKRAANRASAYRWLEVANKLQAHQIRLDAGGTAEMPAEMFDIIVEGYHDLIKRGQDLGVQVIMENHWGASNVPENVVRIIEACPGLGYLFDTHNWASGMKEKGWDLTAKYATATHIKTFEFDENGNEPTVNLPKVIKMLVDLGYNGVWGIESVPRDGDEYGAIPKTMNLIERAVTEAQGS